MYSTAPEWPTTGEHVVNVYSANRGPHLDQTSDVVHLLQVRPAPYLRDGGVLKRQQRTILETSPGGPDSGLWTTSWPHFKQRWTLQCGLHLMPTSGLNSGLKRFSRICIFHQVKRAGLLTTRSNQLQTVGQVLGTSQQRRRNTRTRTKKKVPDEWIGTSCTFSLICLTSLSLLSLHRQLSSEWAAAGSASFMLNVVHI